MGSRSHARHPRDPMRRTWPYRSAPLPLVAGGQGRPAVDVVDSARAWAGAAMLLAALALGAAVVSLL